MHNNAWPPESLHSPRKWSFDKQEYLSLCPPGRCLISCRFLVLHSPLFCSREGLFTSTMQAVRTDSWMHSFWSCFPPPHPPPFFQDMNSPRATLGLLLQKLKLSVTPRDLNSGSVCPCTVPVLDPGRQALAGSE